jgi:hypothetical protein
METELGVAVSIGIILLVFIPKQFSVNAFCLELLGKIIQLVFEVLKAIFFVSRITGMELCFQYRIKGYMDTCGASK